MNECIDVSFFFQINRIVNEMLLNMYSYSSRFVLILTDCDDCTSNLLVSNIKSNFWEKIINKIKWYNKKGFYF